jgi:ParB-like nuclease domain
VRLNDRYYLHNGYHRTYGAMLAGAKYIPAVVRDVADAAAAGVRDDGNTFGLNLLESAHPPTVANFKDIGSAKVGLRAMTRILHVSWAEYAIPDE